MRERIEKRLEELQQELAGGEKMLAELQAKQASVQQAMLRIGGAIRVLQELMQEETAAEGKAGANGSAHP